MQTAQHGVGIAQLDHQRGNGGGGAAHGGLGGFRADAFAAQHAVIGFPVLAKTRIVLGVDAFHVLAQAHAQAGFQDARLDHGRAADQDGRGQAVIEHQLCGAQHALVFALGIGHALGGGGARGTEHRPHQHAGGIDKARQALAVGVHVLDRAHGHARRFGGFGHGRGNAQNQARVKRRRDQVVGAEGQFLAGIGSCHFLADVGLGQVGDFAHAGQLHFLGDLGRAAVERAAEDVRKTQHVVDLVRVVRAAGGDDAVGPHRLGQLGPDFRLRVGERQDDGVFGHGLDHVLR